ncbi:MAG: DUF47 family protein [Selenomonadaceae bacterium]|nr:DUF47 family protein [Selenomonadaceae bacterium]
MFNFSRKDTEFFDLFLENAKYFHLGAVLLDEVIKDPNKTFERIEEILGLESAADEVNERIIAKLNLSFITPIDREDIYSMASELATGVDMLHDALQRIIMYHAGHATEKSARMTKLLVDSTNELLRAFELMHDIKKNQREMLDAVHKVSDYESKGDHIYREDIGILFDEAEVAAKEHGASKAVIHLIKWKDILEDLEQTLDHCKKIAEMIRGVVMKYA